MKCEECGGEGEVEEEFFRPQSFDRDIGIIDSRTVTCEVCNGSGEVDLGEDDLDDE
jgi:DnaJ-class molecular chaperone|tara:strand:+ start:1072 stop:1239 length:168 start_codon:yes stop_codon:yes gene_type:complete